SALFAEQGGKYVWRVDEAGLVSKAAVTLNEQRQVHTGLNDGDRIIISGVSGVTEGIKVREWVKERGL
ncbi:efflux RND transporter periplasmic adaptor subunit, partial [Vibrio cholerae]